MKNHLAKLAAFLLVTCIFLSATAQEAQTAAPKTNAEKLKEMQTRKANAMVDNIAATVKISDEQKTKLQASLLDAIIKADEARAAIKGDDTKLHAWREAKLEDIKNRTKAILTPEQYEQVMKAAETK